LRTIVAAREALGEDAQRAVGDPGDAVGLEVLARDLELVVVGRLAREVLVGEGHAEHVVDAVEVLLGEVHEVGPDAQRLPVAGLEGRDAPAGAGGEAGLAVGSGIGGVELRARGLVEGVGVGLQQLRLGAVLAHLEEVLDEHAEGGAPVADVVLAHGRVAELLEGAHDRVADDGGAQVADVHLLGDVRRRVVHDHGLGPLGRGHAEARVGGELRGLRGDPVGAQADVQEARSRDLRLRGDVGEVHRGHDVRGDVAGLASQALRESHRGVALEVRELRGTDDRVGIRVLGPEGGGEGGLEALGQRDLGSRHAPRVVAAPHGRGTAPWPRTSAVPTLSPCVPS
jgi:hypothetical protein